VSSVARCARTIGAVATLMAACPFGSAANTDAGLWRYAHRAWSAQNSPLSRVGTIAQTPDGYLWLGVDPNIIRFDGMQFVVWTPPPGQQLPGGLLHLFGAGDGTLWIGTTGGLASWKNGQLTPYPALAGFFVQGLAEDRDGTVWAGGWGSPTGKGKLCAIRNGSATCSGDDGVFGDGVRSVYEDTEGVLWVRASSGLWRWKPGPPIRMAEGNGSLTRGENGSALTFILNDKIRQLAGGKITDYPIPDAPSPLTAGALLRDRHGALWIATSYGLLYSYQGVTRLITHSDGLSSDGVFEIFEDREGTIWAGTTSGLDSFHELPFASLAITKGPSSVLAARDGSVWIGTQAGLHRWKDGHITTSRAQTDPGLPSSDIGTMFEDERHRLWFKTNPDGMAVLEAGRFRSVPSVPPGIITAIAGDAHGGLWLQLWRNPSDYGLVHLNDGKLIEKVAWKDLGGGPGAGLVVDPDGGVWTGLFSGGITYFRGGQIRKLELSGPQTGGRRVFNISRTRDGALWTAGELGLSRIAKGVVSTITTANGLPCNTVHWIMEDDVSSYWMYTACGLLRVARTELDAWTADPKRKIQPTVFSGGDGISLRGVLPPTRPLVTKSTDGRIWFENDNKVTVIDPSNIGANLLPPPVHIERITADGKTTDAARGMHLPARVRNVTIDYTALSLAAPERVRFRYKLEGQDPDWSNATNDRKVQYSNLAPRNYRFRVMACNNSGVWNEAGDTLEFWIDPAYYQTNWFRALMAAVVLAALWGLYRLRLYQIAREFNAQLEGRVEERLRVARELHDTLLQSFQASLVQMQSARNLFLRRPEQAAKNLDDAITMAAGAIADGRGAIQELRSHLADEGDLAQLLTAMGQELARSPDAKEHTPSFRVVVEGERQPLNPLIQDEVYRITRELLRNAFGHAEASQIEAEIRYEQRQLCVHVRDDGKGMDAEVLKAGGREGHWGFAGMRERAKRIGARLDFWSEAGAGTEVKVTVPASLAYSAVRKQRRFAALRKKGASV
jgi:signal transduction histidine kinase/ligand-binding sensor domain-containing protein